VSEQKPGLNQGNAKKLIEIAKQALSDLDFLHKELLDAVSKGEREILEVYHGESCVVCRKTIPELTEMLKLIEAPRG
jgi:hypothetical protein